MDMDEHNGYEDDDMGMNDAVGMQDFAYQQAEDEDEKKSVKSEDGEQEMPDEAIDDAMMMLEDDQEPDEDIEFEDGNDAITEEDAWKVISAHFAERGLVSQQLDSFDVFMTNTMQVSYSTRLSPLLVFAFQNLSRLLQSRNGC